MVECDNLAPVLSAGSAAYAAISHYIVRVSRNTLQVDVFALSCKPRSYCERSFMREYCYFFSGKVASRS